MGVLEFFGSLVKHNITSSSIRVDFRQKLPINHFFMDFNSIIHVSSQKIISEINAFLELVLKNIYEQRSLSHPVLTENFQRFRMEDIQPKIKPNSDPSEVIRIFHKHFTEKYIDKLIITLVINSVLYLIRNYCENKDIETLYLAIDGVPSKGKMIEQRQRRYLAAVTEEYEKRILQQYKDYLLDQPDFIYLATKYRIQWSRNKITPGTAFMQKLVTYLRSEKIQSKMKVNRKRMKIIISDMYEVGEGEKKIVNYINKYLANTADQVVIYSPDADMILLCMLLPVSHLQMLRHNQQTSFYDLIDIHMLKDNISYYINNHPQYAQEKFDTDRISRDMVCISTLFGNDFVPKIETVNVKRGFQNILDAYLRVLLELKTKGYYLVQRKNGKYVLNFIFLRHLLKSLLPIENDFIKHNRLYAQYINIGQIKNAFSYMEINEENLVSTYQHFRNEYENLKNAIKNNRNLFYFETHDQFMESLKKSISVTMNNQVINTTYLTNKEMIQLLANYYQANREFPKLSINLNTYSKSIRDPYHQNIIKGCRYNDYQKEIYQFRNMLDQYYVKFNAQPLALIADRIETYYKDYFGIRLYSNNRQLTQEAADVMYDYLVGLVWVFDYYYNDPSHISHWYYHHERAPLIKHLSDFLDQIDIGDFLEIFQTLDQYHVKHLSNYFNPLEQLVYVSPLTPGVLKLLPPNYRDYLTSDNISPFLRNFFVDIRLIVDMLWNEKVSRDIDCRGIIFFNKCLIKSITKPTKEDDKQFLKAIRQIPQTEVSLKRSQNTLPEY